MAAFQGLVLERQGAGGPERSLREVATADLPAGDVTVAVERSALNYKDALAVCHGKPVVRQFPMIAGTDFAGTVTASDNPEFAAGDPVLLTGWGVGESHWGGYAQRARVMGDWLVRRPKAFDADRAMALGTAGLTAMLAVMALTERGITPDHGPVLVTGAAGGVGSVTIVLLTALGYAVTAVTGRGGETDYLHELGARQVLPRNRFAGGPDKPLEPQQWAAVIDQVGGATLARALAQLHAGGLACAVGRAGGKDIPTTVFPFILRGVQLVGIESTHAPQRKRGAAWQRLADAIPGDKLDRLASHTTLAAVPEQAERLLAGQVRGRLIVDIP